MSGDSDYIELVKHLKSEGVRVEIASVDETTSDLLIDHADYSHSIVKDDCFTLPSHKPVKKKTNKKAKKKKQVRRKNSE